MTSFYIQKMVFTKSKNFDERGGEDYFFLKKSVECGSARGGTGSVVWSGVIFLK